VYHNDLQGPARPQRSTVAVERSGDRLGFCYRSREWAGGGFMFLWLIAWTVGCVFLARMVIHEPRLFNILFAVPFWASWIFVFAIMLKTFFQRDHFLLDRDAATFVRRVFFRLKARVVPLAEIRSFDQYTVVVDSESGRCQSGIEMRTAGVPIRMAQGLSDAELDWLQFQLNEHLRGLGGGEAAEETPPQETAATVAAPPAPPAADAACVALSVAESPVSPPSDCCWTRVDGFDDFSFATRGGLGCVLVLGLVFINAFWNGIVSVFVLQLCGRAPVENPPGSAMWWGELVFLIPFEVFGLIMFGVLVAALLEPVHRTVWTFMRQGIEHRSAWLGIGPRWTWEVMSLDRIELRRDAKGLRRASSGRAQSAATVGERFGRNYRLSFVDRSNAELCSINGLTEGEARWIGDVVLRQRAAWFR
jgi:hypothetical protein